MQLGIKTRLSAYDAQRLQSKYGKSVAARVLIVASRLTGVKQLNLVPDLKYNANIVYIDKALPKDLNKYRAYLMDVLNELDIPLWMATIENEVFAGADNYSLQMYLDMLETNYNQWLPKKVKVATSGATNEAVAAITNHYLINYVDKEAAAQFRANWGVVHNAKLGDALMEIALIKSLGMTKMFYNFHWNVTPENVHCLPNVVEALRYYCGKMNDEHRLRIGCNELSFSEQSPALVFQAMEYLKNLSFVFAYSLRGNNEQGVPFTEEMEKVFMSFA